MPSARDKPASQQTSLRKRVAETNFLGLGELSSKLTKAGGKACMSEKARNGISQKKLQTSPGLSRKTA
jgi:hypothetical protein